MSLPALTWRRIADQTVSTTGVAAYLDGLYGALTAVAYTDGSTRTAGAGRAWSVSRYQSGGVTEALTCTPPSGSGCSARVIFAGASGARTPLMGGSETYLANAIHGLVASNGGTLTTWDGTTSSDPLGAGILHTRYLRACGACASTGLVCVYESAEALCVMIRIGTSWYGGCWGAIFDPGSTDALDAEADGRVYGIFTSSSSIIAATFDSASVSWTTGTASSGSNKVYSLVPGTGSIVLCTREAARSAGSSGSGLKSSGRWVTWPLSMRASSTDIDIGELRGVRRTAQGRARQTVYSSGAISMYLVGGSDTATQDVLGLLHA